MLKERARLVDRSLKLFDLALLALAFPVAYWLRDGVLTGKLRPDNLYPIATYWPLLAASLLVWQAASRMSGVYVAYRTLGLGTEILRLARAFVLLALVVAAGHFVWAGREGERISRLFFGLYYASAFALMVANRAVMRSAARAARRRGFNTRAFAVVGSGELAESALEAVRGHAEWGYTFAGWILEEGGRAPSGAPVLGRLAELGEILERHVVDEVVFAVPRERLEDVESAVALCEEQGVGAKVLLHFFPARISRLEIGELEGIPVLQLSTAPTDEGRLVAKRAFDLAVSSLVLALGSPLLLGIALAIKLDSRGPVLFKQRRVGLNGREFWMWKFRSMVHDAEVRRAALEGHNEMDGPVFKMARDPRVTRVGRFLRKTSLDEFPQFWNVLVGQMSVVGPRPPIPDEVRRYQRWQRRRLSVKPGLTCLWQVQGRNELDFAQWMALDLHYIDTWSLWGDLKIFLQTIPAVLLGRGAR
ncbi:MAG TPA: sugar transferase [Anaeromyxobacteraceae bacterium]|nr:sugar transferase [Anaeromyxobacteraceae bacterium]